MHPLYTQTGYRASLQSTNPGTPLHWLFLPGGPGLGSETFLDIGTTLQLPGNTWYVDYPNDGSNQISETNQFDHWHSGLLELLDAFENIVLVAHSFGGMFALSQPEVETRIKGLVLMNTSPNADWLQETPKQAEKYNLPDISQMQIDYLNNPDNKIFKELLLACAPYFFPKVSLEQGEKLLESLPHSHASYDWASTHFHPNYQAAFIPKTIPTLIIGGELDYMTPMKLFSDHKSWDKDNITIECLKDTGHFPWVDSLDNLRDLFKSFCASYRHFFEGGD